jgi:two-component system cell cycle response regulator DivK
VVEDDPDSQLLMRLLLSNEYQVAAYSTAREAMDGLRRDKPDIAFVDVMLPDQDGVEVVRQIRADDSLRDLPVVAVTACVLGSERDRVQRAGFDQVLSKPIIDARAFREHVARWVRPSSRP